MSDKLSLPADIVAWIEEATGRPTLNAHRIPGGGTRQGWFIDLDGPAGESELFLRYSPAPLPEPTAFHRLATEAAVMAALHRAGVPVAKVHAAHPEREAVLLERVSGDTWFSRIKDADKQVAVAQDFMRILAATHRLDPVALNLPELGPVRSAREHALERVTAIRRRAARLDGTTDPLLAITLDWLERNVPSYDGPVVLVQGDTGPGNFLYQNGRVTAVLDWELCHWGDPMDDLAWVTLRAVQDTFTDVPARLNEYAEASGHRIDVDRIRYYRVFAEATMATLLPPADTSRAYDPDRPADRDYGNLMLYQQLHRRLWLEALSEVMDLGLERPEIADPTEHSPWHVHYGEALAMLKTITPRINDPLAAQWSKGVARLVRYLGDLDTSGRDLARAEVEEVGEVLGAEFDSVTAAREALDAAYADGSIDDATYVRCTWNRVMRDDYLMRNASGALGRRTWPPLTAEAS